MLLAGAACMGAGVGACVGAERGAAARVPVRPDSASAAWDSLLALDGPPHAIFGCLTGDSAVYGDVRPDPETGDTIGVWLTFYRAGGGVDGMRVLGGIDRADTATFLRVQLSGGDSLAFDVPAVPLDQFREGIDTARFIGRVACDRVWGRQREHRDQPSRTVVYRRVVQQVTDAPVP